jgi:hypothetical protein
MQTNYFQGKDGFIWWHGVVEDRQDPLYLGRCKVRILGWHTEDKAELPTASLPWAQVLMPVTSASQTNVGHAPVGPVEGTWVMGFYRDGELGQEPVIMGTIPGIPENFAKQGTGFNDPRLDVPSADRQGQDETGKGIKGVPGETLDAFPFPPKDIKTISGGEALVTSYTDTERKALSGGSLYPRETNKPTTSKYARGSADSSASAATIGIISSKNSNTKELDIVVPSFAPSDAFIPKGQSVTDTVSGLSKVGINDYLKSDDYNLLRQVQITKTITQPISAYSAQYPYNHVYESESGHLIEQDDTPGKERLHWYHRSGTFTEFHPAGMRVDRTNAHRYNIVTGNYESIISGEEKKSITTDYTLNLGGRLTLKSGKDISITSETGDVVIDSNTLNTYIGGKNIILDAKDTLILRGGSKIIREDDSAEDKIRGNFGLDVGGAYNVSSGSMSLSTGVGALKLTSGGALQQIVAGNSEESIVNKDYIFGNVFAKKITALNGIISIESTGLIPTTAGIDLNVGLFGLNSSIKMLPLGDMLVTSVTGPTGITMAATANITQTATLIATLVGAVSTVIGSSSSPLTSIDGTAIQVGGSGASEPAILGTTFLKLFSKHTHPSPNGPTGPLSPEFASDLISTVSKKVFLA